MKLPVDLRSDTVTRPCKGMRAAMFEAVVGDDVIGDDPTVEKLERMSAQIMGKEGALFVPSGTMGNQLALFVQTTRGDEVICGRPCHIQEHEVGAAAVISGVSLVPLDARFGELDAAKVEEAVREPDIHHPETGLVCLESAHSSGAVPSMEVLQSVVETACRHEISVHLDGARIFNAALALGVDVKEIASLADSVMFCLSKGLGAPVGSMLCGEKDFIEKARKARKLLGGGMRQVGILAAAGIFALENNIQRLADDHEKAAVMADVLSMIEGVEVVARSSEINMVWFKCTHPRMGGERLVAEMEEKRVLIYPPLGGLWRLVFHKDVDTEDLEYACRCFEEVFSL